MSTVHGMAKTIHMYVFVRVYGILSSNISLYIVIYTVFVYDSGQFYKRGKELSRPVPS